MKRVLVVSDKNSCRSQMAEAWLRYYGRGAVEVESAGIIPAALDPLAAQSMMDAVIDITQQKSKGVNALGSHEFDYVLVLSSGIEHVLPAFKGNPKVFTFPFPDVSSASFPNEAQKRSEYDRLRDEVENFCFDFIHHKIKPLI